MVRVVVIGGMAGGANVATRLRRLKEDFDIFIIEKGSYVSFGSCGLPYYIGGKIKSRESLELATATRFLERYNIDVRLNHEAISIDRKNKKIKVKDLINNEEYELSYDYLVLSPGSKPIKPTLKGIEDVSCFTLRTIADADAIKGYVEKNKPETAVIIGGGFIGLELAENLIRRGIKVTIAEILDHVMPSMDKEMAQFIHQELILNGVFLVLEDGVELVGRKNDKFFVKTKKGRIINTDLIILSVGVQPETKLAREANLKLGIKGHIIINNRMQSSDPTIYALGDAVQVQNLQTHEPNATPLAGPANKQGRITADNIAGRNTIYHGILGASVVKVFDLTAASVGLSEKDLIKSDIKFDKIYLHPNNHVRYYPNAVQINFKLLFEVPSGKILGAQIVGGSGSEKRVDIISTLIKKEGTVFDLEELELTYAPQYGSAKDPINMAGFIASNIIRDNLPIWHWHDLDEIKKKNVIFLDVRTNMEYKLRTIEGSINISDLKFRERINEIPKDRPIYVFCETGFRSYLITRILLQNNFKEVYNLIGGYKILEMATITSEDIFKASENYYKKMERIKDEKYEDFITIDASGLSLPGPLKQLITSLEALPKNKKLQIYSTDPSFKSAIENYHKLNNDVKLLSIKKSKGKIAAILKKG